MNEDFINPFLTDKSRYNYSSYNTCVGLLNAEEQPNSGEIVKTEWNSFQRATGVACFGTLFHILNNGVKRNSETILVNSTSANIRRSYNKIEKEEYFNVKDPISYLVRLDYYGCRQHTNNMSTLDIPSIYEWCTAFKSIIDYDIVIHDKPDRDPENPDTYVGDFMIIIELKRPCISYRGKLERFLLTWIRYVYEFPYSNAALDAMRLRSFVNDQNLLTLFNIVAYSNKYVYGWGSGHSYTYGGGIMTDSDVHKWLKGKEQELNNLCSDTRTYENRTRLNLERIGAEIDLSRPSYEKFENRKGVYLENFEKLLDYYNGHRK